MRALAPGDIVASPHRPHHHALAKGMTPRVVMAELWGRTTGSAGGTRRHDAPHRLLARLFRVERDRRGCGRASRWELRSRRSSARRVRSRSASWATARVNTGRTWESINFAALQKLPLIAVCENNQYAVETFIGRSAALSGSIAERASGFGLPCGAGRRPGRRRGLPRDARGARASAERAGTDVHRGGHLPLSRAQHRRGANYREQAEVEQWRRTKDPIERLRRALESAGRLEHRALRRRSTANARDVVADAIRFAESPPLPDPADGRRSESPRLPFDARGPVA